MALKMMVAMPLAAAVSRPKRMRPRSYHAAAAEWLEGDRTGGEVRGAWRGRGLLLLGWGCSRLRRIVIIRTGAVLPDVVSGRRSLRMLLGLA
jgi:hypothetical protein